ncbi:hypothetical protein QBC44DRAFT_354529 [Cladorrhinum sp. PSN332]|nr:hypothetical protein QBC44DRAFT_354529 [Cladorrhinum sp. PSN332]
MRSFAPLTVASTLLVLVASQTASPSAQPVTPSSPAVASGTIYSSTSAPTGAVGDNEPMCGRGFTYCGYILRDHQKFKEEDIVKAYCAAAKDNCANGKTKTDPIQALYVCVPPSATPQEKGEKDEDEPIKAEKGPDGIWHITNLNKRESKEGKDSNDGGGMVSIDGPRGTTPSATTPISILSNPSNEDVQIIDLACGLGDPGFNDDEPCTSIPRNDNDDESANDRHHHHYHHKRNIPSSSSSSQKGDRHKHNGHLHHSKAPRAANPLPSTPPNTPHSFRAAGVAGAAHRFGGLFNHNKQQLLSARQQSQSQRISTVTIVPAASAAVSVSVPVSPAQSSGLSASDNGMGGGDSCSNTATPGNRIELICSCGGQCLNPEGDHIGRCDAPCS